MSIKIITNIKYSINVRFHHTRETYRVAHSFSLRANVNKDFSFNPIHIFQTREIQVE